MLLSLSVLTVDLISVVCLTIVCYVLEVSMLITYDSCVYLRPGSTGATSVLTPS